MGGHLFKNPSGKLFELDAQTAEFICHKSMEHPRWLHQAVIYKNYIYVIGGTDNDKEIPINYVERFNTNT